MSKLSLLLFATTLALGAITVALFQKLQVERDQNQVLQQRVAQLSRKPTGQEPIQTEQGPPATPASEVVQPPQKAATVAQSDPAEPASKRGRRKDIDAYLEQFKNPKVRASRIARLRMEVEQNHPDLGRLLGLTPQETDRFLDVLAEQEFEDQLRGMTDYYNPRKGESTEERQQRMQELNEKVDAQRRAVIGEERLQAWNEYVNRAPTRQAVAELRVKLVDAGVPLRADQVDPLVADLAAEQQRHRTDRETLFAARRADTTQTPAQIADHMKKRLALIEDHLDKAHDIASAHLTSNQLEVFDQMLERQRKVAKVEYDEFRASAKAQGGR